MGRLFRHSSDKQQYSFKSRTMKTFIALYHNHGTPQHAPAPMSEEEKAAMMAPWGEWKAKYGDRIVNLGAPLMPGSGSKDGNSWAGTSSTVSGFSIVSADSLEAAQEMFVGHPIYSYPDHSIELSECAEM